MIILEGPDGAGKTTLLHTLQARIDLPVAPRVVQKDTRSLVDMVAWVEDNLARGFQATYFDRHRLISEPIYGSVLRHVPQPGFDNFSWLYLSYNNLYRHVKPIIIYCLPPWPVVWANVKDDPDNRAVAEEAKISKIYRLYAAKAASDLSHYHNALVWDYTGSFSVDYLVDAISTRLEGKDIR